jgi:hypothetical protein
MRKRSTLKNFDHKRCPENHLLEREVKRMVYKLPSIYGLQNYLRLMVYKLPSTYGLQITLHLWFTKLPSTYGLQNYLRFMVYKINFDLWFTNYLRFMVYKITCDLGFTNYLPLWFTNYLQQWETRLYYVCFRYSHWIFELCSIKRNEVILCMLQVFSLNIRIMFHKEKPGYTMYASGILIKYSNYLQETETRLFYVCFRYSHWIFELCSIKRKEVILCMLQVFSLNIRITFNKEEMSKRRCVWHLYVFSLQFNIWRRKYTKVIARYSRLEGLKIPLSYVTYLIA